jgi:hypothetical protein
MGETRTESVADVVLTQCGRLTTDRSNGLANLSSSHRRRAGWPFITRSSLGWAGLFGGRPLNQRGGGASTGDEDGAPPVPGDATQPRTPAMWSGLQGDPCREVTGMSMCNSIKQVLGSGGVP